MIHLPLLPSPVQAVVDTVRKGGPLAAAAWELARADGPDMRRAVLEAADLETLTMLTEIETRTGDRRMGAHIRRRAERARVTASLAAMPGRLRFKPVAP